MERKAGAMMWIAAAIVIATLGAMASGKVHPVLALLSGLVTAGLLRIATPQELFGGFSNAGVITVGAMLVIAKGIVSTGVINRVTWSLLATTKSAQQTLRRLMVPIGTASALINTTPLVALTIPATRELEQSKRIPARAVLLPLAHVTTLAGSITLIGTSSNLVIAGMAEDLGVTMSMFSFAPVALPVALVGWVVIYVTAPRLVKKAEKRKAPKKEWRVEIPVSSAALARGRVAADLGLAKTPQYKLTGIERWGDTLPADTPIEPDDVLVFAANEGGVTALWGSPLFGLSPDRLYAVTVKVGESGTLHAFEHDDNLKVIAARTTKALRDTELIPGETCYVAAAGRSAIDHAKDSPVALWQDAASRVPQPGQTWKALTILVAVILSATFGLAPVELAATAGALLMVILGLITPRSAGRALDWKVLAIVGGSIGLGAIVVSSGLAELLADGIRYLADGSTLMVALVFAVATTIMTNLITNAAAASILTPIAIDIAAELSVSPVLLLALIGTCISFTFINPFSHQSNVMVMHPGGYSTATFAKFGVPLVLASIVSASVVTFLLLR